MPIVAASTYEVVIALHVMAVVITFGVTFAYPIIFAIAARSDPRSLPLLHRIECNINRWLVNFGLLAVVVAGLYLASEGHLWSHFFVQWGIGVALVIGGLVGAVMIPTATKAAALAARDIAASSGSQIVFSEDYRRLTKRLTITGSSLSLLVLVTILFMVLKL